LDRTWRLSEALKEAELIGQDWKGEDRRKLLQLLLEFADVFCVDKRDLKRAARAEQMVLDTKGSPPIRQRPYKLGPKETEVMEKEVAGQLKAGVAVKSKSAWASPAFIVWRKQYGSTEEPKPRKVIDYRKFNALCDNDCYPLPDIIQMLEWLATHCVFGSVDCKSGYW
jgi:hypothetical protein